MGRRKRRPDKIEVMKKLLIMALLGVATLAAVCDAALDSSIKAPPTFESAIEIIKSFEGMHSPKHWPYIGYGHRVLKGEKYRKGQQLTAQEADELLRKDFKKYCALYRSYGADSLLLGALAYNVGQGTVAKSGILKKLKAGDRDIEDLYIAHCRYRGREHAQIKRRRQTELATLFVKDLSTLADNSAEPPSVAEWKLPPLMPSTATAGFNTEIKSPFPTI